MPDSLSTPRADTVAVASAPWHTSLCRPHEAPTLIESAQSFTMGKIPWSQGMQPQPRAMLPGYDSGVMCLLIAALVVLAVNFRHCSTYLKNLPSNLWSVKNRDNAFSPTHTISETRIVIAFALIVCVMEGIIVYSLVPAIVPSSWSAGAGVAIATAVAAIYYMAQLVAYSVTGYIFATPRARSLWLKGFNASQSILAITLTVPALWVLFNPGTALTVAFIAAFIYIFVRILFICKGFRIFYINSFSLVYFILYLCTLEIAPLLVLVRLARYFAQ